MLDHFSLQYMKGFTLLYVTKLVGKFDLILMAIEKFWKMLKKQQRSSLNSKAVVVDFQVK